MTRLSSVYTNLMHNYDYPLQECRIHNTHWGVVLGLQNDFQHFHYFSSSNTRWLACESINFFSKEAFSVWEELCIWGVPVQWSHTKVEVQTHKQKYPLDCFLRNVMPLSHIRQLVQISSQYQHRWISDFPGMEEPLCCSICVGLRHNGYLIYLI